MPKATPPCVVSIAGTDPSGGAGIQADIKAISATGSYAATIITALVAQNTQTVHAILEIDPKFVLQQFDSIFSDLNVAAIKIGMLHNPQVIRAVTQGLQNYPVAHVIYDPVMIAKNGAALLEPHTIDLLKAELLPLCTLITPNLPEASVLLGQTIANRSEMASGVWRLANEFNLAVLLKGGHLFDDDAIDVFCSSPHRDLTWYTETRISTRNTHGTGCTLSAALASFLAQGYTPSEAIRLAKQYLTRAIQSGQHFSLGQGHGPVDHFYFLGLKHHEFFPENLPTS